MAGYDAAKKDAWNFKEKFTNDERLEVYALFKQIEQGDVRISVEEAKARLLAWEKVKGMNKDAAVEAYVKLVGDLKKKYGV